MHNIEEKQNTENKLKETQNTDFIVGQGRKQSTYIISYSDDVTCAKQYLSDCTRRGRRRLKTMHGE